MLNNFDGTVSLTTKVNLSLTKVEQAQKAINTMLELLRVCESYDIPFKNIEKIADALFELETGKDLWDCGVPEDDEDKKNG